MTGESTNRETGNNQQGEAEKLNGCVAILSILSLLFQFVVLVYYFFHLDPARVKGKAVLFIFVTTTHSLSLSSVIYNKYQNIPEFPHLPSNYSVTKGACYAACDCYISLYCLNLPETVGYCGY